MNIENIIQLLEEFDYDKNSYDDCKYLIKQIIINLKSFKDFQEYLIMKMIDTLNKED